MPSTLSINSVRSYGTPIRYSPFDNQPIISPNHRLVGVLKAGGPKGTEFAEDVTEPLMYQCAIYSVGPSRGINTRMDLFEVPEQDFEKCLVS